ncbi:hypothetical protein EGH21_02230 [Halomicroarcula sp. F13]|uniref:DUF7310 domain-containing protein n=1 Tax=Haloarcula rubra TaxID=2487747 RepID=A0AAW4PM52_9EURY|nr:hypothetical protein [Halomicroarcula rubra]MBX0321841.1 hypothetical protein [Halomicroarcula rubra]
MTDVETLEERVRTVERAVTDGDHDVPAVEDRAELDARLTAVEDRVDRLDERTADLEAATQALRGYVGNVRSVNEDVEQRADAALAATDRLERRLDDALDDERPSSHPTEPRRPTTDRAGDHQQAPETTVDGPSGDPPTRPADGRTTPVADGGEGDQPTTPDDGVLERIRALL